MVFCGLSSGCCNGGKMATDGGGAVPSIARHRREPRAARALDADNDTPSRLQMHQPSGASLAAPPSSSSPSSSSSPALPPSEYDGKLSNISAALGFRRVPEEDYINAGHYIRSPFGEGEGEGASFSDVSSEGCFLLYSRVLVTDENIGKEWVVLSETGVSIGDPKGELVYANPTLFEGYEIERDVAELEGLIECLNAAINLELKSVALLCDDYLSYLYVSRRLQSNEAKTAKLLGHVDRNKTRFKHCDALLLEGGLWDASKSLREAIIPPTFPSPESICAKKIRVTCEICLEVVDAKHMFFVDHCHHSCCVFCLRRHIRARLHNGKAPNCHHFDCESKLSVHSCGEFLTPEEVELMRLRIKEDSIPVTERVYCPSPQCSALMSLGELLEHSNMIFATSDLNARQCLKCHRLFCINCKAPWHIFISCEDYRWLHPHQSMADAKLNDLVKNERWRQCEKCSHMVELVGGCHHIYCRCGHEFCYVCGAEWKHQKATCSCPFWDEQNIIYD